MILYPAVDIRDGQAVRLVQGDYAREQVYERDPLDAALGWVEQGAEYLHVVDLDGARSGEQTNLAHIKRIAAACDLPLQYGGGLRNADAVAAAIDAGATRAVLGTAAFENREFVRQAVDQWGERIVVSIDARDGFVAAAGWTEETGCPAVEAVERLQEVGVSIFVYTDIARDGMLTGPNIAALGEICAVATGQVIASGGVGTLDHLQQLADLDHSNLNGVIVGKALYDHKFTVTEALSTLAV